MVWEPDPETTTKILWFMSGLMFLVAIVSAIGEYRGWWNSIGELGMTVGTLAGLLIGMLALFSGSSKSQVSTVYDAVRDNGALLGSMDTKLDSLKKLDELDEIQLELDVQTGVLGDQLAVLKEMRDAN